MKSKILYACFLLFLPFLLTKSSETKPSFSLERALQYWYYYSASLCDVTRLESWDLGPISDKYSNISEVKVVYNKTGEALAYLPYDSTENSIYIVFRGSIEKIENWMDNARLFFINYPSCQGCKVDQGFHNHYQDLRQGILENLRILHEKHPSSVIRIIGHSLGATGATLLAPEVKREFGSFFESLYTYGSPRVGNKEFADWWNKVMEDVLNVRITRMRDPGNF